MSAIVKARAYTPRTLNEWSDWLCREEIPIFSNTVQRINSAIDDEDTGATELARIIMEDTTLTAKILKLSNSSLYNPLGQRVSTLTRAAVVLGTKLIHEMALTCTFIEAMQSARNKQRASEEIARSLHAATQARSMALLMQDPSPEEVFIATLLFNIGRIAFSCFEETKGLEIEEAIRGENLPAEKAERRILGFTLQQLGAAMSKTWRLAGLTEEVFGGKSHNPERVNLVKQCDTLARTAEQGGWEGPATRKAIHDLAHLLNKPVRTVQELVKKNAKLAAEIALQLGANEAAKLIPTRTSGEHAAESVAEAAAVAATDPSAQLIRMHQDITNLLSGQFNINVLFELILESIHRGLGMDRTFFALVSPDRRFLKEKSSHGWAAAGSHLPIQVELDAQPLHLFMHALNQSEALWIKPDSDAEARNLFTQPIQTVLGRQECFLFPLSLTRKPIGLLYADRATSGQALDPENFGHFRQLGQQAMIGLRLTSF
ncbi:HDOD domain-containing protein [Methylogaea oryzae]|uniref:HDOD domain-containing protein n=1 Tax=Methylogaea oryzae TaxID=1295382 RepID=A0A8D4VPS1_9GAMM|nr:HDOD domain-containing protein [Methylogaea oryzae]BBL72188.1 hypothetical protein MoryE10_27940 [Methylogaea oryzae]